MKPGACERLNAMSGLFPVSFEVDGVDGGLHKVLRRLPPVLRRLIETFKEVSLLVQGDLDRGVPAPGIGLA